MARTFIIETYIKICNAPFHCFIFDYPNPNPNPNPIIRHFTATAFVLDSRGRTLLLWHKRLRRWMPPGGHVDPDEAPEDTARRECKEETGLDVEIEGGGGNSQSSG